jgi:hypothetical protein
VQKIGENSEFFFDEFLESDFFQQKTDDFPFNFTEKLG